MTEKMKKSAEKITMPDDVRERIIDKCSEIEKAERSGNNSYTDHVFTVERAKPNRIRRVVSGIAACAVLAGGIGATGVFLHRQGSGNIASEVAQEACYVLPPFGDLSQYDYALSARDENEEWTEYGKSAELSDFLNRFNWGEETEPLPAEQTDNYTGRVYEIHWIDEYYHGVEVHDNGDVIFRINNANLIDPTSSFEQTQLLEMKYYHIDFAEFDRGVLEIIGADNAEEPTEDEAMIQSITDEMTEKMCLAVNDGSYSTQLVTYGDIVSDEGRQHDLDVQRQDMTNAMMFAMCGWIGDNSDIYDGARSGKILFEVSVDQGDSGIAAFTFFEEGFYTYAVTNEDGTESTYIFKGDCYEALDILKSAMDTEKKHTEDNPAYYLPEFNFVKMGIDGSLGLDEEMCRKLQDIFYGYDYSAHEVRDVDTSTLEPVYSFKTRIGGNEQDYMRVLEVCNDGYICIITTDLDGNKVNAWHELVYKFNDNDILDAINELFDMDNEQLVEEHRRSAEEQAKLAEERRLNDEARKLQEEIEQRVHEEEQKLTENAAEAEEILNN